MAFWAVIGYENIYDGLHGMQEIDILEGTEDAAYERAIELSYNVITSYDDIIDILEEEVKDLCDYNEIDYEDEDNEDEIENFRTRVYDEDIVTECIELDTTKLPTLNLDKLYNMFYNTPHDFLEKYSLK